MSVSLCLLVICACAVFSMPLENSDLNVEAVVEQAARAHRIRRRFIDPMFGLGTPDAGDLDKMRTKRSEDECEKLQLCKLHARSRQSFFAAYELYFVNKENAKLWDHRARSSAECEQRYSDCYK